MDVGVVVGGARRVVGGDSGRGIDGGGGELFALQGVDGVPRGGTPAMARGRAGLGAAVGSFELSRAVVVVRRLRGGAGALLELAALVLHAPVLRMHQFGAFENLARGGVASESAFAFGEAEEAHHVSGLGVEAALVECSRRLNRFRVVLRPSLEARPRRPRLDGPSSERTRDLKLLASDRGVAVGVSSLAHRPRVSEVMIFRIGLDASLVQLSSLVQITTLRLQSRQRLQQVRVGGIRAQAPRVRRRRRPSVAERLFDLTQGVNDGGIIFIQRARLCEKLTGSFNFAHTSETLRPDLVRLRLRRDGLRRRDFTAGTRFDEQVDGSRKQVFVRCAARLIRGRHLHHAPLAQNFRANERLVFAVQQRRSIETPRPLGITLKEFETCPLFPHHDLTRRACRALIKQLTRGLGSPSSDQIPHKLPLHQAALGIAHGCRRFASREVHFAGVLVTRRDRRAHRGDELRVLIDRITGWYLRGVHIDHRIGLVDDLFLVHRNQRDGVDGGQRLRVSLR